MADKTKPTTTTKPKITHPAMSTPFSAYFRQLDTIDKDLKDTEEYGSILILSLVEEIGEMARAYLAEHGRKPTNLAAQRDETYQEELGDIMVTILRFARIKQINLDDLVQYSMKKIEKRRVQPTQEPSPFEEKKISESTPVMQQPMTSQKQSSSHAQTDEDDLGIPAFIRRKMM